MKEKIIAYILKNNRYKKNDGLLNEQLLLDDILSLNTELINYLYNIEDEEIKKRLFSIQGEITVFNQIFVNKIIFDISVSKEDTVRLEYPHKNSVLVGGMGFEDKKGEEVFYNKDFDRDKIDKFLKPKVFTKIKRFFYVKDERDNQEVYNPNNIKEKKCNAIGFKNGKLQDNLLIKGNNLLSLHSLAARMKEKIDVIYIDPPYYFRSKKADDAFAYNSNFKLSTWLTFMSNRLEIAKELLSEEGVIFISMNEDGSHYLKLLCDEIFGVENFISNMFWKNGGGKNDTKSIKNQKENILVYQKGKGFFNLLKSDEKNYRFFDEEKKEKYAKAGFSRHGLTYVKSLDYKIEVPAAIHKENHRIFIYPGGSEELFNKRQKGEYEANDWRWTLSKKEFNKRLKNNEIIFEKKNDKWKVYYKSFYKNKFTAFSNIIEIAGTSREIKDLFEGKIVFNNPKPSKLLIHLLKIATKPDSVILDFFAGSGTTGHAVLSLNKEDGGNRKFILMEQMDFVETITAERIKRVMVKEKIEDSFVYMEILKDISYDKNIQSELSVSDKEFNHSFYENSLF